MFNIFCRTDDFSLGRTFFETCFFYNFLIYFSTTHTAENYGLNFLNGFTRATDSVSITMCSESAAGQDTFLFRHRFCHADFYDALQAFNLVDTTLPDPSIRMRGGPRGHYSYFLCRYGDLVDE